MSPRPRRALPPSSTGLSRTAHTAALSHAFPLFLARFVPTAESYRTAETYRAALEQLVRLVEPQATVVVYGSMANGCALIQSDLDLCVLLPREGWYLLRGKMLIR